jgi:hypothetical protein
MSFGNRITAALVLLLLLAPTAHTKTNLDPGNLDQFVCDTSPGRTAAELAEDRFNRLRRPAALSSTLEAVTVDRGSIAVLEDDGTVITQPNRLDLANSTITFTPAGPAAYSVVTQAGLFDAGSGTATPVTLGDDDTTQVSLPFPFVFYGARYNSVFLNTDGNLTFTSSDVASSDRNLTRVLSGPPRIAVLFDDLNPLAPAQISVEKFADRVLFTWTDVGEWTAAGSRGRNTFQAVLNSDGVIRFNYRNLDAGDAVVGVAPGRTADVTPALIDFAAQTVPATVSGVIAEVFATTQKMDLLQVGKIFYRTHADAYDGLIVFADFNISLDQAFAFAVPLRNSIRGIINTHPDIYDFGAEFGSPQRLSVMVNMGDLSRYPANPRNKFLGENNSLSILGQEFGHRWLAYLDVGSPSLLGRDRSHWSFLHNTFGSVVEGNEIADLGNGNFRTIAAVTRYSPLDQYVMGLRPASQVPPWFVVGNPVLPATLPPGFPSSCRDLQRLPACGPFVGLDFSGTRRDVTIDEIISAVGPRSPSFEQAQKDFRVAFILVTQRGRVAQVSSLQNLDNFRSQWQTFFNDAVENRGTMRTDLLPIMATEFRADIPANGSRHVETLGTSSSLQVGYSTLDSSIGVSVVRFISGSVIRSEAAVPAATVGTAFRMYVERTDRASTGIAIVNTQSAAASITAQLSDGRQTTIQLGARAEKSQFVHELFPDIGTSFAGSLSLTSNVPIAVLALRGTINQANDFIMASVPIFSGSTTMESTVLPQIADGSGYATELILLNPSATAITGSVEFSISVATDRGTNTTFPYTIAAGGTWTLKTTGTRPDVRTGFATVRPAAGAIAPVATAILKQFTGNNLNFEAGVPGVRPFTRGVMFGVLDATHRTALAIVNRETGAAGVQLTALRSDGTTAAPPKTISLASSGHTAAFLDELIPELPSGFDGTVLVESASPVYAMTLRTLVNTAGTFLVTAMPVVDLNQPAPPATSYFPQLVDGENYTTEFLLLNATSTSARLQFFNTAGQPLPVPVR